MKTVIIGSGMAGLTAGAYLAKAGHEVIVYEQFPTPGGVTATLRQDGFAWDIGPLLLDGFAPGDKGRIVLEELGVSEKVKMIRADRGLVMRDIALWKPEVYAGPYLAPGAPEADLPRGKRAPGWLLPLLRPHAGADGARQALREREGSGRAVAQAAHAACLPGRQGNTSSGTAPS